MDEAPKAPSKPKMGSVCVLVTRLWLSATPWTVAHQAPLSVEFSRQESWPFFRGVFLTQRWNLSLLPFQADSLQSEPPGKPKVCSEMIQIQQKFGQKIGAGEEGLGI